MSVTFNQSAFLQRYPQFSGFANANPGALQTRFDEVTAIYINNGPAPRVVNDAERSILINYAIAHILTLDGATAPGGQGSNSGHVGRVSSAAEGSVSASFDIGLVPNTAAWWMQTQYGAAYWNATAKYRTFQYAGAPRSIRAWPR